MSEAGTDETEGFLAYCNDCDEPTIHKHSDDEAYHICQTCGDRW